MGIYRPSKRLFIILILFGFLFVSCIPGQNPDAQDWPDDDDIATMIALTLTQLSEEGSSVNQGGESQEEGEPTLIFNLEGIFSEEPTMDHEAIIVVSETPESSPEQEQGSDEGDPIATVTPPVTPSADPTSTHTVVVVTSTQEPQNLAGIPGFDAGELVDSLVGFGFVCSMPEDRIGGSYNRQCDFTTEDYQYVVKVWGQTERSIDLIEASAFYFGSMDYTDLTAVIFGIISEISYENALPQEAKEWVYNKIDVIQIVGDESVDEFGGVRYHIYALPSAQVLEIGRK